MRADRIGVIATREYLARIRSKGFWLATLGLPVLMGAALLLPTLLLTQASSEHRVVIVDTTGTFGEALIEELSGPLDLNLPSGPFGDELDDVSTPEAGGFSGFVATLEDAAADRTAQRAELDRRILESEIDAWVWITEEGLREDRIEYHSANVSNFVTQSELTRAASAAVRTFRMREAGLDPEQVARLGRSVDLTTVRVSEQGSREEGASPGLVLAYILFFLLYMAILVYGQQVMVGVLEEKSSRIVEVIVATTRPIELMFGKLLGICCVGLTQLGIWIGTVAIFTFKPVVAAMSFLPDSVEIPTLEPMLLVHFFAFFVLGFFLYSTFYGSVGAAFNNVQEAQQFASVGAILVIAPMFLFLAVLNDPDSTLSVVASLVPLFTPLLMMLRLTVKAPPTWQVALGYALTIALTWLMIWVCARIYRVGILMYGKKPSLPEIWRWIRHS